ncbi:hypothetical protein KX816_14360 [Sphingosinicellaceae bacterium]|nr:hypothetical protein KX816_14360 [Sphingosinicellaceae bacterium]
MTLALIVALLQGAAAAAPPAPPPATLTAPPLRATVAPWPTAAPAAAPAPARRYHDQLFIAPSGEPFRAARGEPYPVDVWFARADANHDGKLTRTEFRKDFMTYFEVLDVNHDGIVDAKEITRYEEDLVPEVRVGFGSGPEFRQMSPSAGPDGGDSGGEEAPAQSKRAMPDLPRGGGRYGLINAPEPVVSCDTDLNRRVTSSEYAAAADRRFSLLDPGEIGYLTLATLPKTPIQARGQFRVTKPK